MTEPVNRIVQDSIDLMNQSAGFSTLRDRLLANYDAASPSEQRAQFETLLMLAAGAVTKLGLHDPETLAKVLERSDAR